MMVKTPIVQLVTSNVPPVKNSLNVTLVPSTDLLPQTVNVTINTMKPTMSVTNVTTDVLFVLKPTNVLNVSVKEKVMIVLVHLENSKLLVTTLVTVVYVPTNVLNVLDQLINVLLVEETELESANVIVQPDTSNPD